MEDVEIAVSIHDTKLIELAEDAIKSPNKHGSNGILYLFFGVFIIVNLAGSIMTNIVRKLLIIASNTSPMLIISSTAMFVMILAVPVFLLWSSWSTRREARQWSDLANTLENKYVEPPFRA